MNWKRSFSRVVGIVLLTSLAACSETAPTKASSTPDGTAGAEQAKVDPTKVESKSKSERPKTNNARTIPDAPAEVAADAYITTESGLQYFDLVEGSGDSPQNRGVVKVEYSGFFEDGTLFDSSFKRPDGFTFIIGASQVIKGWDEGVATMKTGGKRQLKIPGDLAYGPKGKPPRIPPNATLIFDVELLEVAPPRVAPEAPQAVADEQYTTTDSGLKFFDFQEGTGETPKTGQRVKVDYTGWLVDGKLFDSSLKRAQPIEFPIGKGRVVKGWDEGISTMKVGGKRQLRIPADLAYGERGRPPVIPPSSELIFEVELVAIN